MDAQCHTCVSPNLVTTTLQTHKSPPCPSLGPYVIAFASPFLPPSPPPSEQELLDLALRRTTITQYLQVMETADTDVSSVRIFFKNDMKNEGDPPLPSRYYRSLGTRCANIVNRVRNAAALPYAPSHLLCNISFDLMQDPVIAPSGYTYERPLTLAQLYPDRALKEAISYYQNNYQSFAIPK